MLIFRNSLFMQKISLLFLLLVFSLGGGAHAQILQPGEPGEVGMSTSRLNRLDQVIQDAIAEEETQGAMVLVARKGKIVYRKAFGLRAADPDERLSFDTVFDMASLTKVMATATSAMILVEEGKLVLSDSVKTYIPEFDNREKGKISVLQLLTHYSGLRPDLDLNVPWKGYEKAIELACSERLVAEPGEEFIYSDINYFLVGEIIRRVSGEPLDVFAAEKIFKPLNLSNTGFNPSSRLLPRIAPTEERDGKMIRGEVHDPTSFRMGGVAGHAGLFSTLDDTAVWAQMILNGGIYSGIRILSPLAALKMTTPQSPSGMYDWRGIGFDMDTRFSTTRGDLFPVGSFGHTGFTGNSVWIDPYTETIVLLFSSRLYPDGKGSVVSLRSRVASVVAASILDVSLEREKYYQRF